MAKPDNAKHNRGNMMHFLQNLRKYRYNGAQNNETVWEKELMTFANVFQSDELF